KSGLPLGRVSSLAVDPGTPSTVYAGSQSADGVLVFKSTDAGATWNLSSSGLPSSGIFEISALVIDPQTPSTVYAGTIGTGVFKSVNGGASWSAVNNGLIGLGILALVIDPVTPSTLYAGTTPVTSSEPLQGMFKSTNGGGSWSAINNGLSN